MWFFAGKKHRCPWFSTLLLPGIMNWDLHDSLKYWKYLGRQQTDMFFSFSELLIVYLKILFSHHPPIQALWEIQTFYCGAKNCYENKHRVAFWVLTSASSTRLAQRKGCNKMKKTNSNSRCIIFDFCNGLKYASKCIGEHCSSVEK